MDPQAVFFAFGGWGNRWIGNSKVPFPMTPRLGRERKRKHRKRTHAASLFFAVSFCPPFFSVPFSGVSVFYVALSLRERIADGSLAAAWLVAALAALASAEMRKRAKKREGPGARWKLVGSLSKELSLDPSKAPVASSPHEYGR